MHDETETGHGVGNIHRSAAGKRSRDDADDWDAEGSFWLLQLRFKELRDRFDQAQTVAMVHEAWGLVAQRLKSVLGLSVNAVECSDQLSNLRQQWEARDGEDDSPLALQMAECFSPDAVGPQPSAEALASASFGFSLQKSTETEETSSTSETQSEVLDEAVETEEPPKKKQNVAEEVLDGESATEEIVIEAPSLLEPLSDVSDLPREGDILNAFERRALLLVRRDQLQKEETELIQKLFAVVAASHA
ncbi:hypothetical protein PHYBOEH_009940 [Phytophthora boehmeriae]|uniref:Uncharacterized protein n=1 Tax=Phytophthora boehmeriae TaxID=109152 RepID=A0A8T1VTI9_9STRA|nr:hypothetical protein PHYBOEH_009940 [Phytophthora boehmeriae]